MIIKVSVIYFIAKKNRGANILRGFELSKDLISSN